MDFFPFTDSIKMLKKNNCNVIAQPYGSVNDDKIISSAYKIIFHFYILQKIDFLDIKMKKSFQICSDSC